MLYEFIEWYKHYKDARIAMASLKYCIVRHQCRIALECIIGTVLLIVLIIIPFFFINNCAYR